MKILDEYDKYQIPPNLAEHQMTVASVANNICDLIGHDDTKNVVTACLLHDMGNIIKFNYDKEIPGLVVENIDYWRRVQNEFISKYGKDEHLATIEISTEIGVNEKILGLINAVGFRHSLDTLHSGDVSKMIAAYSDMRVAPLGVTKLESRLGDLAKRYGESPDREQYNEAFREIEKIIFSDSDYTPEEITTSSVHDYKEKLEEFVV